ncbi:beta-N-acetylhexosaminidase [Yeosuana sp. MJ-SS3]|uniref:beta-N-acetylhexosaminidase n=1 Tax=Gilvirhabdus luticola TaxID=3079858 RepID=A0ABU3U6L0_9FLAO|nr:beta-N-acetylhexosaminidase [Yeosuana sp. MJ-SS3]MDU8886039.1 beta-N-acetylhexosaminidase [Yeosuana sp. MJ-SS3]
MPNILPKPQSQQIINKSLELSSPIKLYANNEFDLAADFLTSFITSGSGMEVMFVDQLKDATIILKYDEGIENREEYVLDINENRIKILSKTNNGAFYGVQSLRQMLPFSFESGNYSEKKVELPCVVINDKPRFSYRGMHLDVSRHFFKVEEVKKYIDHLAMLKFNTFHWHLTDDQGWRIEIKKYPKLTTTGGFRDETLIGHYSQEPEQYDGQKYGGYYTQEEIKDVVAYATKRSITVIPEIEMPGHSLAALSAYPEYGCVGNQYKSATKWGIFDDIYCSKDSTFTFLEDILDEVIALFPSTYIHIGGDEAPKKRWEKCNECQSVMNREGIKNEHELQSYFITKIEKYLNGKGRQIIGWDEILEGGLAPNATVMSWRGDEGAIQAAKQHHNVILTPNSHVYFDYYQSDDKDNEPLAIGGYLPLEKVYNFNPISKELSIEESKYVLGGQANIWTEYIPDFKQVEYMFFPRAIALSEVLWTYDNLEYKDFIYRLSIFEDRLDTLKINHFTKYKD